MATPDYSINYDDKRFAEVEGDKQAALNEVDVTYGNMISNSDKYFDKQIEAAQDYADKQSQIQQEQTDFAIEQIEQQKADAKKDYTKEQSGAYVDWQKQSNQYGANAEAMAAQGMQNTGFSESSQVSMYNTYQNRVATARESYNRAVQNYNNAITEARLQNNAALAEIAYNALQKQLELSLQGFQYKNELLIAQSDKKFQLESEYHDRYQDVLAQINQENALAEEVRQHNEQMAMEQKQLEEEQRQFNESMAWDKEQYYAKNSGGGGGDGGGDNPSGTPQYTIDKGDDTPESNPPSNDNPDKVLNRHADTWVEIPGHGRFTWTEVKVYVEDGTIKETQGKDGIKYTWVGKKPASYNVTPDKKGYAARQANLMAIK